MFDILKQMATFQLLSNLVNNFYIGSNEFKEVLDVYGEYLIPGCEYLLKNQEHIKTLLVSINVDTKAYGNDTESKQFTVNYLIKNTDTIEPLFKVMTAYSKNEVALIRALIKYKESLLHMAKTYFSATCTEASPEAPKAKPEEKVEAKSPGCSYKFLRGTKTNQLCGKEVYAYDYCKICLNKTDARAEMERRGITPMVIDELNKMKSISTHVKLPKINICLIATKLMQQLEDVKAWNDAHPFEDKLISSVVPDDLKYVVAGSKALTNLIEYLKNKPSYRKITTVKFPDFKSTDTDIFYMGEPKDRCDKVDSVGVDIVYSIKKTVSELLLAFDLPCCRVAQDRHGNFYFTAKSFEAIFTGRVVMPGYTNPINAAKLANKYIEQAKVKRGYADYCANRVHQRIQKYTERGFKFEYLDTEEPMEFLTRNTTDFIDAYSGVGDDKDDSSDSDIKEPLVKKVSKVVVDDDDE
jgi:hypothetical protein